MYLQFTAHLIHFMDIHKYKQMYELSFINVMQ